MSYIGLHRVKREDKYTENKIYIYWITPPAKICSESSDSDKYVMLFCLPSSDFIFMPASPFRVEPEVVNVLSSISAVYDHQYRQSNTDQSM